MRGVCTSPFFFFVLRRGSSSLQFASGLFDQPLADEAAWTTLDAPAHRQLAREAAEQGSFPSCVLRPQHATEAIRAPLFYHFLFGLCVAILHETGEEVLEGNA